jgi:hypothetical protein
MVRLAVCLYGRFFRDAAPEGEPSMRTDRPQFPATRPWTLACAAIVLVAGGCEGSHGPTGITTGMAVGKFCHQLTHNSQPTTLSLEVGDKVHFTRFVAVTGGCQPEAPAPCLAIPVGLVELRVKEGDVLLATRQVILHDGEEYLFQPGVNSLDGTLGIGGGPLLKGRCMNLHFTDGGVASDGGTSDAGLDALAGEAGVTDAGVADASPADTSVDVPATDTTAADTTSDDAAADLAVTPDATTD